MSFQEFVSPDLADQESSPATASYPTATSDDPPGSSQPDGGEHDPRSASKRRQKPVPPSPVQSAVIPSSEPHDPRSARLRRPGSASGGRR